MLHRLRPSTRRPPRCLRLAGLPLLFDPGSELAYGLSTDVLGYLVEVVSGQPLDRFFADRIFGPLGMSDTYFYLPEPKAGRLLMYDKSGQFLEQHRDDIIEDEKEKA